MSPEYDTSEIHPDWCHSENGPSVGVDSCDRACTNVGDPEGVSPSCQPPWRSADVELVCHLCARWVNFDDGSLICISYPDGPSTNVDVNRPITDEDGNIIDEIFLLLLGASSWGESPEDEQNGEKW